MFDWYRPAVEVACPVCGEAIDSWQGWDGPNALFVWVQHEQHPVEQRVDPDARIEPSRFVEFELPASFKITGFCPNQHTTLAECVCREGIWETTAIISDPDHPV